MAHATPRGAGLVVIIPRGCRSGEMSFSEPWTKLSFGRRAAGVSRLKACQNVWTACGIDQVGSRPQLDFDVPFPQPVISPAQRFCRKPIGRVVVPWVTRSARA